jgi:hypothetical protein
MSTPPYDPRRPLQGTIASQNQPLRMPTAVVPPPAPRPTAEHGSGQPPWHMWGNTQALDLLASNAPLTGQQNTTVGQLLRVAYRRPETWHWVFAATLLDGPTLGVGDSAAVSVIFDLTIGVGRSQLTIPFFETFTWNWAASAPPIGQLTRTKWSTQVNGPVRVDSDPTPPANVIDQIVAQDIQLNVRSLLGGIGVAGTTARVEVSAHFSPKTHIRPEWSLWRFPGAEES